MGRLGMADLAEKTLDAQYYIWDADTTGRILADRLLRAADRGRSRTPVDGGLLPQSIRVHRQFQPCP